MRFVIEVQMETKVWVCARPTDDHQVLYDTLEQAKKAAWWWYGPELIRGRVRVRADPGESYRRERWEKHFRITAAEGRADTKRINHTVESALKEMHDSPRWESWRQHQAFLEWEKKQGRGGDA